MRSKLNKLYLYSGYLSAFFMVLIALTIVAQILGRFVNITVDSTETAGFSLAALTFFRLSYTFHSGEHIRVTLFTRLLGKKVRRYQELFSLSFCIIITSYLTYWSWDFVYFSFIFDDISPGLLAIGVTIFLIALVDDFFTVLKRGQPSYVKNANPILKDNT